MTKYKAIKVDRVDRTTILGIVKGILYKNLD